MEPNTAFPGNAVLTQTKKFAQREFEGQMLIITTKDSRLHRLNAVGTFIWKMLENPTPTQSLLSALKENFSDFDGRKDELSVVQFLLRLQKKGLISIQ